MRSAVFSAMEIYPVPLFVFSSPPPRSSENWTRGRKPARSTFRPRSRAFLSLRERHTRAAKSDSNYVNLTKSLVVRDESLYFSLSLSLERMEQYPPCKGGFSRFNIRWGGRSDIILSSLLKLVITLIIAPAFSRGVSRIQEKIRWPRMLKFIYIS